jgi:hypothetical protein
VKVTTKEIAVSSLRFSYLAAILGLLALLTAPLSSASTSDAGGLPPAPATFQPGDQVWTDTTGVPPAHVTLPFVSPDPGVVRVIFTPVPSYQPGDKVWTSSPQVPPTAQPDANGCQRVPSSGFIGHNVSASTSNEYANFWYWSSGSSSESFSWWIKKTDGTVVAHGASPGGGGSQSVAANIYYWQVQNTGSDPQAWNACYEVR